MATRGRNRPLAAAFSMGMIALVLMVLSLYMKASKDRTGEGLFQ
jgi:ABC-type spermidine/putrescine transport system permease subunit I